MPRCRPLETLRAKHTCISSQREFAQNQNTLFGVALPAWAERRSREARGKPYRDSGEVYRATVTLRRWWDRWPSSRTADKMDKILGVEKAPNPPSKLLSRHAR